jgi:triosephosphate isomerase
MRKKLIAANWKMYKTPEQAQAFVSAFVPLVAGHERNEIVLCPPFVLIPQVGWALRGSKIALGGQDMFWESEGAYTGAVSAQMLHAVGCSHVIIGHSERRQYYGETDDTVNRK